MSADGQGVLVLSVPVALEDAVVDWLLALEPPVGFGSQPIRGHGTRASAMDVAEQVAGHQKRLRFEVVAPLARLHDMVAGLKRDFAEADLFYWIAPVADSGHMTDAGPDGGGGSPA